MENLTELGILLKYLILGLFQGFTEPIPISSSGHLVMLRHIFNLQDQLAGLSFENSCQHRLFNSSINRFSQGSYSFNTKRFTLHITKR
jgi:undecaprenyl pyrophosphate phosphatase UppP